MPNNKQLYNDLEQMRTHDPVTWAILVGKRTPSKIAEHLIMSPPQVKRNIDNLLKDGVVTWGSYMGRPILQISDPSYKELAEFAWRFRQKVLGKNTAATGK